MPTPNPLAPVKGAGTTLWVYNGQGDAYANPLSDDNWQRLAQVKDLTPGEMTAEPYDDNYLDDEDADWTATGQGQKSAGDTSFTLAWKPGEEGQKGLIGWFESGDVRAYKIRFPNGTVDVFRGWVSSIGKAVTAKEVITRTVKVTNVGKPSVAEERSEITPVTAIKVTPTSGTVAKGKTTTLTVSFEPESATDKTFRAVSADPSTGTIAVKDMAITVTGVKAGKVSIVGWRSILGCLKHEKNSVQALCGAGLRGFHGFWTILGKMLKNAFFCALFWALLIRFWRDFNILCVCLI